MHTEKSLIVSFYKLIGGQPKFYARAGIIFTKLHKTDLDHWVNKIQRSLAPLELKPISTQWSDQGNRTYSKLDSRKITVYQLPITK